MQITLKRHRIPSYISLSLTSLSLDEEFHDTINLMKIKGIQRFHSLTQ